MNTLQQYDFPMVMPVITESELIYPFMTIPPFTRDEDNIKAAHKAVEENSLVFIAFDDEQEQKKSFYEVGVIASIMRETALPDGRVKLLCKGLYRGKILSILQSLDEPLQAEVDIFVCKD